VSNQLTQTDDVKVIGIVRQWRPQND